MTAPSLAPDASEALYRNAFDHAGVGIAHATREGRLLRCNPHLCKLLGYTEEELTRKTLSELTHWDDRATDAFEERRVQSGELSSYRVEKRFIGKNGEAVWVSATIGAVRDCAGALQFTTAVVEDIHLRRLTHLALQVLNTELTGEEFMRQMTQTLATLLGVEVAFVGEVAASQRHIDTRAIHVDGTFVPNFSYALEGTPCEAVMGGTLCIHEAHVQRLFPNGQALTSMGIESFAAAPLRGTTTDGAPLGVLAIMSRQPLKDLESVRAVLPMLASRIGAELLREREAKKFRDLFDSSPSAIFLIDEQGMIRNCSRAAERLFGWEPQDLVGQTLELLIPEEHNDDYQAKLRLFVEREYTAAMDHGSTDIWARRRDGGIFPAQVQLRVLKTAEGRMTVALVQDITDRKHAEATLRQHGVELESRVAARTVELLQARDDAQQANRAKSAFLATMSHEIRTPMNGVVGMIDVLEQTPLKSDQMELVKTVRESAYALLSIVDGVLDFSKIEAGQFQVECEPMDVAEVVEGVCDTLDHLAGQKDVELTLFTDPAIPVQVLGDAARLRQVLLNLTGNAVKFSNSQERPGCVSVRASVVERDLHRVVLEFSVCDNGIGMDQDTLDRLFTPFAQADAGTTRRFGGTGLGLSISHGLVELMGGQIGVRSEPGSGSTFTVRLPLALLPCAPAQNGNASEIAGLDCLVLGEPRGRADDLAVYLAHGGAAAHRARDLDAARAWFNNCSPGLWTGIIVCVDRKIDDTLAELRALCGSRPDLVVRFIVIESGRRRVPRVKALDLVSIDGDVLRRSVFLKAVALAAGRVIEDGARAAPSDTEALPGPLSMREATLQNRLILVAEDNEINQKVIRKQLALLGYTAHIIRNGREALECSRRRNYPLLLTDLHMPEMDGYELAQAIRKAEGGQRRMPIVALTANALKGEARRCHDVGMDDYMTKPVQLASLKAMLHKWMPAAVKPAPQTPPPASSGCAAGGLALDVRVLQALVGDDPEVINEFLHDFRLSVAQALMEMRAACHAHEPASVTTVAHKLKSSARAVGALALGELCVQMEAAGQARRLETLAELLPRFEAEVVAVNDCLQGIVGVKAGA